jgi:hypothetical protein
LIASLRVVAALQQRDGVGVLKAEAKNILEFTELLNKTLRGVPVVRLIIEADDTRQAFGKSDFLGYRQLGKTETHVIEDVLLVLGIRESLRLPKSPPPAVVDIDAIEQGGWIGALPRRVLELGTDPATGTLRLSEGIAGVRIERYLGRTIRRSIDGAADFVDDELGPISLKGPIPKKGSLEGLANAAIKDAQRNTATKTLFVDTQGLSEEEVQRLKALISDGTKDSPRTKTIIFLE